MLAKLLAYLLAFLRLSAVEGAQDPPTDPDPDAGGTDPDTQTTLDDFLDDAEGDLGGTPPARVDPDESPAEKRAREASERAEAAERRANDAERRARELESRPAPSATRDPEYEREEAQIAAAKAAGQDTTWIEWKIDLERRNRENLREANRERALSADARDAAQFERIEATHPKLFSKYRERVEQWRQESMKNGAQPAPRLAILDLLIGNDMRNGKLKVKTRTRAADAPVDKRTVDRGLTTRARSDVDSKQRRSESEKRRERLRDQLI